MAEQYFHCTENKALRIDYKPLALFTYFCKKKFIQLCGDRICMNGRLYLYGNVSYAVCEDRYSIKIIIIRNVLHPCVRDVCCAVWCTYEKMTLQYYGTAKLVIV